jgi:hypothetical protein
MSTWEQEQRMKAWRTAIVIAGIVFAAACLYWLSHLPSDVGSLRDI